MTANLFYRCCLALPLALPVLLSAAVLALEAGGTEVPGALGAPALFLFGSLIVAGIPYSIFAVGLFIWLRRKDWQFIQHFSLVVPLAFFLIFAATWVATCWIRWGHPFSAGTVLADLGALAAFVLPLGYVYVLFAWLLFRVGVRGGWIRAV